MGAHATRARARGAGADLAGALVELGLEPAQLREHELLLRRNLPPAPHSAPINPMNPEQLIHLPIDRSSRALLIHGQLLIY